MLIAFGERRASQAKRKIRRVKRAHLVSWAFGLISLMIALICLFTLISGSLAMGEGPYVLDLDRTSFNQSIALLSPSAPCLIEFYASWCGHCVHFAPEWKKITQAFHGFDLASHGRSLGNVSWKEKEIFTARVDCAKEADGLCKQFNVPAFPHLTMSTAQSFQARNTSAITIYKSTLGNNDAKHIIRWTAEELKSDWGVSLDNTVVESLIQRSEQPELASPSSPTSTLSVPSPPPLLPKGVLWTRTDVESASIYLYQSITSQTSISGSEKREALQKLIRLWSIAHPSSGCKDGSLVLLQAFDTQAWPENEQRPKESFLTDHKICGSIALDQYLKTPKEDRYLACRGSKEGTRGFTCGLWLLFHTLAVGLPEWKLDDSGRVMMEGLRAFSSHFFLCRECSLHFTGLLNSESARSVRTRKDAIIWLWENHNSVNARLMEQEKGLPSHSSDPLHPKIIFPSLVDCPKCRHKDHASGDRNQDWNMVEVLRFLVTSYGPLQGGGLERTNKNEEARKTGLTHGLTSTNQEWVEEDVQSSAFSSEQLSSSWMYLELNLFLVVLGLCIVGSLIVSSVCMRRVRGKESKIKFHYSDNV
jgi:thiol oxidase